MQNRFRFTKVAMMLVTTALLFLTGCSGDSTEESRSAPSGLAAFMRLESEQALFGMDQGKMELLLLNLDEQLARGEIPVREGKPVRSLLTLLQRHLESDSLDELGLAPRFQAVWHMRGWLPLLQVRLADGEAFQKALEQAQETAGQRWDGAEFQGVRFYRSKGPETELLWMVHANHLLLSWFPLGQEQTVLEGILSGHGLLDAQASEQALKSLPSEYRRQGPHVVSGWLNTQALLSSLSRDATPLVQNWRRILEVPDTAATPACQQVLARWTDLFPGVYFHQIDDREGNRQVRALFRLAPGLANRLKRVATRFVAIPDEKALVQLQVAANPQQWLVEWQGFLQQDVPADGACPWFASLHRQLEQAERQLARKPMPGLVRNIQGMGLSLDVVSDQLVAENVRAMAWVQMDKPEQLLNMGSMFEPGLAAENWPADGKARPLPERLAAYGRTQAPLWLARLDTRLGVAVGEGMDLPLERQLKRSPETAGTLLWFRQDMQRVFRLMGTQARMAVAMRMDPLALQRLDRLSRNMAELSLRLDSADDGLLLQMEQRAP